MINIGIVGGGVEMWIGDDCLLMVGCYVVYDVIVGDWVIIVNSLVVVGYC